MPIRVRDLGKQPYLPVWQNMKTLTETRTHDSADEIWLTEHDPVFTLGLNGKSEHILNARDIPVVNTDRGGQVTYHGPGQLVVYTLIDLKRHHINIRQLVSLLEDTMIKTLAHYGVTAIARPDAPGVYVNGKKIGSVGLRIKRNCSYHGLSLNNAMNLLPFRQINPCGYPDLEVTQLADLGVNVSNQELAIPLVQSLTTSLST